MAHIDVFFSLHQVLQQIVLVFFFLMIPPPPELSPLPLPAPLPIGPAPPAHPPAPPRTASRSDRAAAAAPQGAPPTGLEDGEVLITTPMLGTFYRSPKPGEPPFV